MKNIRVETYKIWIRQISIYKIWIRQISNILVHWDMISNNNWQIWQTNMASLYIYAQIRFISREIYVGNMTNIGMGFDLPKYGYKNTNGRIRKKYMHECKISQIIRKYESRYSGIVWVKICVNSRGQICANIVSQI